jgi:hypothetical protein
MTNARIDFLSTPSTEAGIARMFAYAKAVVDAVSEAESTAAVIGDDVVMENLSEIVAVAGVTLGCYDGQPAVMSEDIGRARTLMAIGRLEWLRDSFGPLFDSWSLARLRAA